MRFKDYTWPHNPEVYSVEARRQVAVHKVPFGQYVLQDLGTTYRVLEGQGVFDINQNCRYLFQRRNRNRLAVNLANTSLSDQFSAKHNHPILWKNVFFF